MKLVRVLDDQSKIFCFTVKNEAICLVLCSCQLVVTMAALAQHIVSLVKYDNIFLCRFNQSQYPVTERSAFLAADIIIFDFGLFHYLIGVKECIANYLDGGYMRGLWCLGQTFALCMLFVVPCIQRPHPMWLFPMLIMENFYVLGLVVLTLATINPTITTILYNLNWNIFLKMFTYFLGASANFFFNYVLWHYYWHIEEQYKAGATPPVNV